MESCPCCSCLRFIDLTWSLKRLESDFWKAYRELARMYPDGNFPGGYSSTEVQRLLMSTMDSSDNWEDALDKTVRFMNGVYEEEEAQDYEEFFDIVDDEEDLPF